MKRSAKLLALVAVAAAALLVPASGAQAEFGFTGFDVTYTNPDDSPATLAGAHTFEQTTAFEVNTFTHPTLGEIPDEALKDFTAIQIPGLVGSPIATPRCTSLDFLASDPATGAKCGDATQVGFAESVLLEAGNPPVPSQVFNLVPSPGTAAMLGFWVLTVPVIVEIGVADEAPFNIEARARNTPQTVPVIGTEVKIWGVPADPAHDVLRGGCFASGGDGSCKVPAGVPAKPFLTLPRACEGPLKTEYEIASWTDPLDVVSGFSLTHDELGEPQGFEDCAALEFAPQVGAAPTTNLSESPSGFDFSIEIDDPGLTDPDDRADSDLKKAVVTLPKGLAVNPAAAGGLAACTQAQLAGESFDSVPGEGCPEASKVASVEVETPLLEEQLRGSIFLAEPYANPLGTLLAGYLVIKSPERGIAVKVAGKIEADPSTGQLTASFDENPQLPFSNLDVSFPAGPRASLITPSTCGKYEIQTELYPWSGGASVSSSEAFEITGAPGGGACPTDPGALPNSPSFDAGTLSPISKAHSPFVVNLRREDGSQRFSTVTVRPPAGLVAKLAGTELCSEAALQTAATKPGKAEQASPSCPPSAKIGSVFAAAGAGPAPYWAPGSAYLAGPYKGAPLSMAILTPAVAGPFDLGTIVLRTAIHVDAKTAEITAVSDPLPQILEGIPLDIRAASVRLDRPGFALTGTSCDPSAVSGLLGTTLGNFANLFSRYQLSDCRRLGFKPKISLRLKGSTKRGGHPALTVILKPRPGDANIASLSLAMPRSEFLEQAHIRTICTRVQFASDSCPAGAIYGQATVQTQLFDFPLKGNLYLRASDNQLPDLVPDLRGPSYLPIKVESAGRTDSIRGGIRNTFDFIPDAPFTKLVSKLPGGAKSLLVNSRDICKRAYRATVKYTAHNGMTYVDHPKLQVRCKGKRRKGDRRRGK